MSLYEIMQASMIPEGKSGEWSVVKQRDGTYLYCNQSAIMFDNHDEMAMHFSFLEVATGKILVVGLGLGCVPQLTTSTVINIS